MEADLVHFRRWQFEDFQARAATLIPPLLEANAAMSALDLMAALEEIEAPVPLGPDRRAWVLDQYLVTKLVTSTAPDRVPARPRRPLRRPARATAAPVPAATAVEPRAPTGRRAGGRRTDR